MHRSLILLPLLILALPCPGYAFGPTTKLTVTVASGADDRPLAGASLEVTFGLADKQRRQQDAVADADGRVELEVPRDGLRAIVLFASSPGHVRTRMSWSTRGSDVPLAFPSAATMRLPRAGTIGGVVVDADGNPVAGARLVIWARNYETSWNHGESTIGLTEELVCDDEGRWRWDAAPLPLEDFTLGHAFADSGAPLQPQRPIPASLAELQAQTAVLQMPAPPAPMDPIQGVVRDAQGTPLAGASVQPCWKTGANSQALRIQGRHATTDLNGAFRLAGLTPPPPGPNLNAPAPQLWLLIQEEAHAPQRTRVSIPPDATLELQLETGRPLRGRVVGDSGAPIAGARLSASWADMVASIWSTETGPDGTFAWPHAPAGRLSLYVRAADYTDLRPELEQVPDDELVLTLRRVERIVGSVTDAESGAPLSDFTVAPSRSESERPSADPMRSVPGQGGRYQIVRGSDDARLLFTAPGYQDHLSPVLEHGQPVTVLDVQLTPARSYSGRVLDHDNQPVEGAAVYLVAGRSRFLFFRDGAPDRRYNGLFQSAQETKTDDAGRWTLQPEQAPRGIVALHDAGIAVRSAGALGWVPDPNTATPSTDVVLERFARVCGHLPNRGDEESERRVLGGSGRDLHGGPLVSWRVMTTADADGNYCLAPMPPWTARIGPALTDQEHRYSQEVHLDPGATLQLALGERGRTVRAQVNMPEGTDCLSLNVGLYRRGDEVPEEVRDRGPEAVAAWHRAWRESPVGRAHKAAPTSFHAIDRGAGAFCFDDVPPGRYWLSASCGTARAIKSFEVPDFRDAADTAEVTVPPATLQARPPRPDLVGEAAPAVHGTTLAGTEFDLAELRGRYVLLDFWATWCGPCVAMTPQLKELYQAYQNDPRFALVGISMDRKLQHVRDYVGKHEIRWPQIYAADGEIPEAYGIQSIPTLLLIGPDGNVVAELRRRELLEQVRVHLPKP